MTHSHSDRWSAGHECARHWKTFLTVGALALAAAFVVAAGIPDEYSAQVKISDERKETDILIGLNAFSAWARGAVNERKGLRMPEVYAKTVTTREFAKMLGKVKVEGRGTDYYHYILKHHRDPWWTRLAQWAFGQKEESERVTDIIQDNIRSESSSIYNTTVLQVTDQDPLVAAMMTDSVCKLLEQRLVRHQHQRAARDYYQAQIKTARAEAHFRKMQQTYINFTDGHADISSPAVQATADQLQKEYDEAFSNYNKELEQTRRALALLHKRPATFAILKNTTVPLRASEPATVGYVLSFLFVALTVTAWGILGRRKLQELRSVRPTTPPTQTTPEEWTSSSLSL